ncbi:hypothetical protein FisN_17Lh311 [Fistulifera solaris]|uniref:LRAT domain-containing protein n=1 Tax=Fistulifera solaris TaxID=1519565 RepID=A0A1Z5J5K8_FISSO|nr:hypothetical protein FisN_17Lh311 [Fistulifera solaris]|eukprot:GAX09226.1 hypothetical protein FisN_17Lh311 [Fistulifera solaris]
MTCDDDDPECWEDLPDEKSDATMDAITLVSHRESPANVASFDPWEILQQSNHANTHKDGLASIEGTVDPSTRRHNCPEASSSSLLTEMNKEKDEMVNWRIVSKVNGQLRRKAKTFVPGDHIYMHCKAGVLDYQHHGILLDIRKAPQDGIILKIADFTNNSNTIALPTSLTSSSLSQLSLPKEHDAVEIRGLRVSEFDSEEWHVVEYGAPTDLCQASPPGTRTSAFCDCRRVVLARVDFLVRNPHVLPDYELLEANCECVAVWCKTGVWATTQVASVLLDAAVKKAGVALAATGIAAALPLTIPAEGLLGVAGLTTQVSLLAAAPWIPVVGILAVGATALLLQSSNNKWRDRTDFLNQRFREYTAAIILQRWWRRKGELR